MICDRRAPRLQQFTEASHLSRDFHDALVAFTGGGYSTMSARAIEMKSLRLNNLVAKLDEGVWWNLVVGGLEVLMFLCLLLMFGRFQI